MTFTFVSLINIFENNMSQLPLLMILKNCQIHFFFIMSNNKKQAPTFRRMFTTEEDELIKHLVEVEGIRNWAQIAEKIEDRTPKQCKDRYNNYLSPGIKNLPWTQAEDQLLLQKVKEFGHKWTKIVNFFPGRGSNNLKNRWHKVLSKEYDQSSSQNKFNFDSSPEIMTSVPITKTIENPVSEPNLFILDEQQETSFDVLNFTFDELGDDLIWEIE